MIDKSLNEPINSEDQDYIMKVIRRDYLNDSTVTICLIGSNSAENLHPFINQYYIKKNYKPLCLTLQLVQKWNSWYRSSFYV